MQIFKFYRLAKCDTQNLAFSILFTELIWNMPLLSKNAIFFISTIVPHAPGLQLGPWCSEWKWVP